VILLTGQSQELLGRKTQAVGAGADLFYAFPPDYWPSGEIVQTIWERLREMPSGQTLLVLPEGVTINYLTRMPSPVAPFYFFAAATRDGREQILVDQLQQHPPDWVVIANRDLREFGIRRYGEAPGKGQLIMRWVLARYDLVMPVRGSSARTVAVLLKRKTL
jgi:hypothetical protein